MRIFSLVLLSALLGFANTSYAKKPLDEKEITNILIKQSIRNYSGSCPCPFNRDKAGRRCGKRSAWSKPSGKSPLCFPSDVTETMISSYKKAIKKSKQEKSLFSQPKMGEFTTPW